jgi:two-component system LytT family response regulator
VSQGEWGVMIVDDEPAARRGVRQLLSPFPDFRVLAECRDGSEVIAQLDVVRPHVVFLDIQMPGVDGFETIRRRTPELMPAIVFLSAYDEFALRAFDSHAFDYLVKPVPAARFAATIARLRRHLANDASISTPSGVVVTNARETIVVRFNEIDWISSEDNYSRIWQGSRSMLVREPLSTLEARAASYGFVRAHRGALVRVPVVRALARTADGETFAVLTSGTRVPVARRRRAAFAKAVKEHT